MRLVSIISSLSFYKFLSTLLGIQFICTLYLLKTYIYNFSCLIFISQKGISFTYQISIYFFDFICRGDFSRGEQFNLDMRDESRSVQCYFYVLESVVKDVSLGRCLNSSFSNKSESVYYFLSATVDGLFYEITECCYYVYCSEISISSISLIGLIVVVVVADSITISSV